MPSKRFKVKKHLNAYRVIDTKNHEWVLEYNNRFDALNICIEWNVHNIGPAEIVVCGPMGEDKSYCRGIHLDRPSERDIADAIETAERDNFGTIYLHYPNIVRFDSASLEVLKRHEEHKRSQSP